MISRTRNHNFFQKSHNYSYKKTIYNFLDKHGESDKWKDPEKLKNANVFASN